MKIRLWSGFFAVAFLMVPSFAFADYGTATVERITSIYDADTFRADLAGPNGEPWPEIIAKRAPIRINGIDAPELRGRLNIHGHVHAASIDDPRYINVSCEAVDYTPVNMVSLAAGYRRPEVGIPALKGGENVKDFLQ